ncbi:phage baseplate assembly protein V [Microbulbifer sp. 2201CG32-9]|uniref:phage baseplate assembly protein V n=1 Tax=Microbulbifer sp. 2201CG32-9 TaxID=3232309 RepID=UPI00345BCAAC
MESHTQLYRLLANLIRLGTIVEVQHREARCRVQSGELATAPLRWISLRAGATTQWDPPAIGEQVLLLSPGGDLQQGLVLRGLYSQANPAPDNVGTSHLVRYPDGAEIRYDHEAHQLTATLPEDGSAAITAGGGMTLNGPLTVNGDTRIVGATQIEGATGIKGEVEVDGGIEATGDVKGEGVSLAHHRTTGVTPGGGLSGEPQ